MADTPVGNIRERHQFGPLYDILQYRLPNVRTARGILDIPGLAKATGLSHEALYRACRNDSLRTNVALRLIRYSHETEGANAIFWEDLLPFMLPSYDRYSARSTSREEADDLDDMLG